MNLSPDNRTTLETLLAGLSGGVSGAQAAPILAATLQAQSAQAAARKQQYQDMATNVTGMAGAGATYGATGNYIDAMTQQSGIPGRFQGLLDSAFQNGDVPQSLQPMPGQYSHGLYAQDFGNPQASMQSPQIQAQMQSPLYTQNPQAAGAYNMMPDQSGQISGDLLTSPDQSRMAGLMAQPAPANPVESDQIGTINANITKMKGLGYTPEQIVELIHKDPVNEGVILSNLNIFMQSQPEVAALMAPGLGV